jgi:hypothetical protein
MYTESPITLETVANLRLVHLKIFFSSISSQEEYDAQTLELAAKLEREVEGLKQKGNGTDPKLDESPALVLNLSSESKSAGAANLGDSFFKRPEAGDLVPHSNSLKPEPHKNSPVNTTEEETKQLGIELSPSSQKFVALDTVVRQEEDGAVFRPNLRQSVGYNTGQQLGMTTLPPCSRKFVTVDSDTRLEFDDEDGIHPFFWRCHSVGNALFSASDGIPSAPPIQFKPEAPPPIDLEPGHQRKNLSPSAPEEDADIFVLSLEQCHELLKSRSRDMLADDPPTLSELQQMKRERSERAKLRRKKGLAALEEMVSFETIDEFVIEERDVPSTSSLDSLASKYSGNMFSGCSQANRNSVWGHIVPSDDDPHEDVGSESPAEATFVCPNEHCQKSYRQVESLYRHVRQKHPPKRVKDDEKQRVVVTQPKGTPPTPSVVMALKGGGRANIRLFRSHLNLL